MSEDVVMGRTQLTGWRSRGVMSAIVMALLAAACSAEPIDSAGRTTALDEPSAVPDGANFEPGVARSTPGTSSTTTEPTTTLAATTTTTTTRLAPTTTAAPLVGWDAVEAYLRTTIIGGGSDALSAAVMSDGDLVYAVSGGARTLDGTEPARAEQRFRIASISKVVASITMLQLVEEGLVGLDDPLVSIIAAALGVTSVPAELANISARQLLTHRSGFPQYEDLFFDNEVASCDDAAKVGITGPLQSVPGTAFQYSNMNFCLVGLAIEILTGRQLADAVDARLLAPLGITSMRLAGTFDVGPFDVQHRSTAGRNYMETLGAAGAWIATASDVVAIVNSLDLDTPGWKPLDAPTVALMRTITVDPPPPAQAPTDPPTETTTTLPPPPPVSGYGMGLMIFGEGSFGHTGTVESTHAMTVRRPDGYTWAITVSGEYPSSTRALADIMSNALLLGGFVDGTFTPAPAPLTTVAPPTSSTTTEG